MLRCLAFLTGAALAAPVFAEAPRLALPIDCTLGDTCYIQNYVDRDSAAETDADFMCQDLTYDGHKGTDFALPSLADMQKGVDVLASASGVVRGTRDEMPDTGLSSDVDGRECGNGVLLDHGDGWQTQYCHMKLGSVTVHKGDRVKAGGVLGQVGYSGKTEFPHVHLSLRHNGEVVDPFEPKASAECGSQSIPLWTTDIGYQAGGLIQLGFSSHLPSFEAVKSGTAHEPEMDSTASAVVIWGYVFGTRHGDVLELTINGPEGLNFTHKALFKKEQALAYRAAGKKLNAETWPAGVYKGQVRFIRQGKSIGEQSVTMTVAP
ncbi:M23 family metallopeptidase [Lentibacter algarum]|uniref:M23 family metallopeptidase n=1 Tax=Lentibacter algarum TaxID=576131 RepID=UPI001C07EC13|nr:M23 family metallopeptidase [Lentibacter algarum]MBU2980967.1 M23 family metallopeptidase [Lentibacter algarum]